MAGITKGVPQINSYSQKTDLTDPATRQAIADYLKNALSPNVSPEAAPAEDRSPEAQGLLQPAPDAARAAYLQAHPNYLNQVNAFNNGQSQISGQQPAPDTMTQALGKRKAAPQNYPAIDPNEVPRGSN